MRDRQWHGVRVSGAVGGKNGGAQAAPALRGAPHGPSPRRGGRRGDCAHGCAVQPADRGLQRLRPIILDERTALAVGGGGGGMRGRAAASRRWRPALGPRGACSGGAPARLWPPPSGVAAAAATACACARAATHLGGAVLPGDDGRVGHCARMGVWWRAVRGPARGEEPERASQSAPIAAGTRPARPCTAATAACTPVLCAPDAPCRSAGRARGRAAERVLRGPPESGALGSRARPGGAPLPTVLKKLRTSSRSASLARPHTKRRAPPEPAPRSPILS
jgi:hypothetical protein